MTLDQRILALAEEVGKDIQALLAQDGDLTSLNTSAKTNLVAAINEVASNSGLTNLSKTGETGTQLTIVSDTGDDVILTGATVALAGLMVAADKSKLDGIETGATADQTGAEIKTAYELEANTNAFTDALLSKLNAIAAGATVNNTDAYLLNRANHTGTQLSSTISDFTAEVQALIDNVIDAAPGTLNTLNELAAALGDDPNYAATIATELGNRLRIDVNTQTLTVQQQLNGCTNLGIGNPDTNFVATYITARDNP